MLENVFDFSLNLKVSRQTQIETTKINDKIIARYIPTNASIEYGLAKLQCQVYFRVLYGTNILLSFGLK